MLSLLYLVLPLVLRLWLLLLLARLLLSLCIYYAALPYSSASTINSIHQ